jgi:hypothetical protein
MKKHLLQKYDYVLWLIRLLLIMSILINLVLILFQFLTDQHVTHRELLDAISRRIEQVFWALLTFILTFLPDYIEKHQHIHLPHVLEILIVIFLYASIFLSARLGLYYHLFWWDDFLHTLSGVIIGFLGFIVMYKINEKYSMDISPLLVAVFAFTFAVTMGVLWEIFEFSMDIMFGTDMQKWNLPTTVWILGRSYQGSGLRDTMSDLIVDSLGALITSVICYFLYKNEKKKTLAMMHEIFPDELQEIRSIEEC